jgi:hypothetical protein
LAELDRRKLLAGAIGFSAASLAAFNSQSAAAAPGWDEIYFDQNGLIVQRNVGGGSGDGGDTAQREGWAWFGKYVRERHLSTPDPWAISPPIDFQPTLNLLEKDMTGKFRRHPTQVQHSDTAGFSRDQLTPLLAAMAIAGDTARLARSRGALNYCSFPAPFKCVQDTRDLAGADILNIYHRGLAEPLDASQDPNNFNGIDGDVLLLGGVVVRLYQAHANPDDVGDDLNLIIQLLVSNLINPTPVSKLAKQIYIKGVMSALPEVRSILQALAPDLIILLALVPADILSSPGWKWLSGLRDGVLPMVGSDDWNSVARGRPISSGCYLTRYRAAFPGDFNADEATMAARIKTGISLGWTPDCPPALGALRWYFRIETGGSPALAELYQPIVRQFLS